MKPIAFDPATKQLVPCGELTRHDVSAKFVAGEGIKLTSVWEDEAGLLWDFSDSFSISPNLRPVKLPLHGRANYVIGYSQQSSSPVHADSYEQAVAKLTQQLQRDGRASAEVINSFHLKFVCGI